MTTQYATKKNEKTPPTQNRGYIANLMPKPKKSDKKTREFFLNFFSCIGRYVMYDDGMIRMTKKNGELTMKSVVASNRFAVGDVVSWKSKSGNEYTGTVASIKLGERDDLIVVELPNGQYRSFYDNATDWRIES